MSMLLKDALYNYSTRLKPKPLQFSDDGQDRSFFSRRSLTNVFSPTIKHFSFDGSGGLPFGRRSPSPRGHSTESLASNESFDLDWDQKALLELSDSVRASLRKDNAVGPEAERLSSFLEAVLKDEERKQPTLDFEAIEFARLDKLLAELLAFAEMVKVASFTADLPLRFRVDVSHAKSLQRIWRRRFREQFFMMDQHRCAILVKGGRLKDVSFNNSLTYDVSKWETKMSDPISELEGNLQYEAGHWWLNITCAERDGIVGSSLEMPTKGRYGSTTLPLLTGWEELIRTNTVKYIREGRSSDMHIALISQVGRQIRILRGYRLKSIFAPQAGVRYDGLFTIKQYGCKLDDKTNTYRLELTMERVPDQKSFDEIRGVPKPSQLDDWNLYEKLEGDKIKILQGDSNYLEWKLTRQEDKVDREEWRRVCAFRASFSWQGGPPL
ncbi:Uu.00g005530.m01.CDS01 [Anthostomella pinea]|uniref:Uu.00g005530.m01.CDS01 n=1 Tax=Anthostomella pinea TaxID=933095 RepID=A0AAI8YJ15_9PEZI|nr:Uu.00g005530.m01.CDS01 [Anthostomella pinea]